MATEKYDALVGFNFRPAPADDEVRVEAGARDVALPAAAAEALLAMGAVRPALAKRATKAKA